MTPKIDSVTSSEILELKRSIYSQSLIEFTKAAWHVEHPSTPFVPNWHIDAIADHLTAQINGDIRFLIINVPPGAGKSLMCGVMFPCFEWTRNPHIQTVAVSMDQDLANRDNRRARELILSPWYQELWPMQLANDSNAVGKFTNQKKGYRWAVPMSGITGKRGDRVIIDDAISANNVTKDAYRNEVNESFHRSATTRFNDPKRSTMTIIQQRLHQDDLCASILEKDSRYETLVIPMEYIPTTFVSSIGWSDPRKEAGELMFPARWGEEELAPERAKPFEYAAQFQQDPIPKANGLFKRADFKFYTTDEDDGKPTLPKTLNYYITSDSANGGKDYNVVRVWGVDDKRRFWLVDSFRERCSIGTALGFKTGDDGRMTIAERGALAFVKKYRPLCWFSEPDALFKGNLETIKAVMRVTGHSCRIELATGFTNKKVEKSAAYQSQSQLGMVYLPDNSIGEDAVIEYCAFPVGKNDDQVDADSILPRMMTHAAFIAPVETKRRVDDYVGWGDSGGDDSATSNCF